MTTAWPDMLRATRFRFALWPYYLLAGEAAYRRLWILTLGAGTAAFAARIAVLMTLVGSDRFGVGPAQYVLYEGIAAFICAPVSGMLVDWRSPRQVLVWTELTRCVALTVFALAGQPALLPFVIIFLGGCTVVHQAARDACLQDTLPARRVTRASALDQAASWGAVIIGPMLGVALVSMVDLRIVAAILATVHLLLVVAAYGLPERRGTPVTGYAALLPRVTLRSTGVLVLAVFGFSALTGSIWIAVAPQMIAHDWQAAASWIGAQVTIAGVAAIAGSLAAPSLIARIGLVRAMRWLSAAEALAFTAYALSPSLATSAVAVGLIGLIAGAFLAAFYAYLQHAADEQERGRLFALVRQIDAAALLIAGLAASLMASVLPPWMILGVAAAIYLGSTMIYATRPHPEQQT